MGLFSLIVLVVVEFTEMFLKGLPGSGGAFRHICELMGGVEEVLKILGMLSVLDTLVELVTLRIHGILGCINIKLDLFAKCALVELLGGGLGLKVGSGGGKPISQC